MSRVLVFQTLFIASRSGLCLAFYNAYFLVFYVQKTVCNDCSLLSSQPFTCLCGGLNKAGMCQLLLPEELHRSNAGIAILHAEHATCCTKKPWHLKPTSIPMLTNTNRQKLGSSVQGRTWAGRHFPVS